MFIVLFYFIIYNQGFLDGSVVKKSTCNVADTGDLASIPGLGRSPGEGNGNPFQYSCLENSMDRGAWRATGHRVTKSQTQMRMHALDILQLFQNLTKYKKNFNV